jgi:hypothetical protein
MTHSRAGGSRRRAFLARTRRLWAEEKMTGEESRKLKSGDRIFWRDGMTNQGTVRGTSWSDVTD